jgi:hypothetical protein
MPYSGRSIHWQHEEMKKMQPIRQLKWYQQEVVQSTLKEVVYSVAVGGMIAGAIVGLFL